MDTNSNHGELTYKQRLISLNILPLCYEREISVLVLFFRALGSTHLDINTRAVARALIGWVGVYSYIRVMPH